MTADFIAHQQVANGDSCYQWIQWAIFEGKARGIQWVRVSYPPKHPLEIWFEGWLVKPDDQGPEPWQVP